MLRLSLLCSLFLVFANSKETNGTDVELNKKQDAGPTSVNSRFFDLGGIINQLLPGFNQGNLGGAGRNPTGMNFPANSQFYPTIPIQGQTPQLPLSPGNNWPVLDDAKQYPNQGFSPQPQYPNTGNFGGFPQGQYPGNVIGSQPNPQYPNQVGGIPANQFQQYPNQVTNGAPMQGQNQYPGNLGGPFVNQFPQTPNQGNFGGLQNPQFPNQGNLGGIQNPQFPNQGNLGGIQNPQFLNQGNLGGIQYSQFPNQGNPGGIQNSQLPNQGNFGGSPTNQIPQYPNQGNVMGSNPQYPNAVTGIPFNQYPNQIGGGGSPVQTQYPNQGGFLNQNPNNIGSGSGQDGTLDGIVPPQNPWNSDTPNDMSPIQFNSSESNTPTEGTPSGGTNAILGKPVIVPSTTTEPGQIVFPSSTDSAAKKQCVQDCQTTTEYNPVCGSDGITYINPGKFVCARNCGIDVFVARRGRCPNDTPFPRNVLPGSGNT